MKFGVTALRMCMVEPLNKIMLTATYTMNFHRTYASRDSLMNIVLVETLQMYNLCERLLFLDLRINIYNVVSRISIVLVYFWSHSLNGEQSFESRPILIPLPPRQESEPGQPAYPVTACPHHQVAPTRGGARCTKKTTQWHHLPPLSRSWTV